MLVTRTASAAFTARFESEDELREEHRVNLAANALRLPSAETLPLHSKLLVTLVGPWAAEAHVQATVVAQLPDALALAIDGNTDELLARLLDGRPPEGEAANGSSDDAKKQSAWDRLRSRSQMEKILLAVKADRSERALLLQDSDPRVLLSLLRNPRVTVDEVARLVRSAFLTYQLADAVVKTGQWMSSLDVRLGLIHNPKTPPAIALGILPSLPEAEVRAIARSGTSMALKQAALKRLQGR